MYGLVLVQVWVVFSDLNLVIMVELVNFVVSGLLLFIVGIGLVVNKWFLLCSNCKCVKCVGWMERCFLRLLVLFWV